MMKNTPKIGGGGSGFYVTWNFTRRPFFDWTI